MIMVGSAQYPAAQCTTCAPSSPSSSGSLPEHRDQRTGPATCHRGGRGLVAPAARGRPQRQRLLRGDGRARQRAARTRGAADRCAGRRAGPDRLDDRRRQRSAARARPAAGRRAADLRRGAPGRAGATAAARARGMRAAGALRRASRTRSKRGRGWSSALTCPGSPGGSTPPGWPRPTRSCCSTAPRASAHCPWMSGACRDFYAASGQKWLCGPNGIGYVYARADRVDARCERPGPLAGARRPRSARLAAPSGRAPARHGLPGSPSGPVGPRRARRPRGARHRARAGAGDRAGSRARRPARGAWRRGRAGAARRSCRSPSTTRPRRSSACSRPASCSAICRGPGTCASVGGWTTDEESDRFTDIVAG